MRWHIHRNQLSPSKAETKTRNGKTTQLKQERLKMKMNRKWQILNTYWAIFLASDYDDDNDGDDEEIELRSGTKQSKTTWHGTQKIN